MKVVVPGEPVPKARARRGARGNYYTPRQTVEYESAVAWACRAQRERFHEEDVRVQLDLFYSVRNGKDADNVLKSCLDALQMSGVIVNDKQVTRIMVQVHQDSENPRTEMEVELT